MSKYATTIMGHGDNKMDKEDKRRHQSIINLNRNRNRNRSRNRNKNKNLATTMSTPATRSKALYLYRKLMRSAMKMPTPNRQNFVIRKTRTEFKASILLTDPDEINEAIRLADTNLDTVLVQAEHLTKLKNDPNYDEI
jgi:hypothetical protein